MSDNELLEKIDGLILNYVELINSNLSVSKFTEIDRAISALSGLLKTRAEIVNPCLNCPND